MATEHKGPHTYHVIRFILTARDEATLRRLAAVEGDTLSATLRRLIREEARRCGLPARPETEEGQG